MHRRISDYRQLINLFVNGLLSIFHESSYRVATEVAAGSVIADVPACLLQQRVNADSGFLFWRHASSIADDSRASAKQGKVTSKIGFQPPSSLRKQLHL